MYNTIEIYIFIKCHPQTKNDRRWNIITIKVPGKHKIRSGRFIQNSIVFNFT